MEFKVYKEYVKNIKFGKHLPDSVYIHKSSLNNAVPLPLLAYIENILNALKGVRKQWNILKFYKRDNKLSLLYYPDFFNDSYPSLKTSQTVDLLKKTFRTSNYSY